MIQQTWNAADYGEHARFVADLAERPLFELLQLRPGERVLDLGCGDGALSAKLAGQGAIVVGVDSSPQMVAAALQRGIDARLLDARALPFLGEFDAVFSNAVLHWVQDLGPVLEGVHRALTPGGRFVGECGGHGCVAAVCTALRAVAGRHGVDLTLPWAFRTTDDFGRSLASSGFDAVSLQLVPRPTILESGISSWLRTFAGWAFDDVPQEDRERAFHETVELLRPALCDSQGRWTADYVRLRFAARPV